MAPSNERFTGFPFKKSATLLTGFETYPWGGATQNPEPLNNGAQANNVQDVCAVDTDVCKYSRFTNVEAEAFEMTFRAQS